MKAKEDEVSATVFCGSRQFDEIEQMNVVSGDLSEAGKSSTTGTIDKEKNKGSNKDASIGDLSAPVGEVGNGGESPAAGETLEAAVEAASKTTDELSKTTDKLSKSTDEVHAWLVSKFNEPTQFSK